MSGLKLFITFSKKSLFICLAAAIITVLLAGQFLSSGTNDAVGSTNALRVSYINGLGLTVDETPELKKDIVIPWEFSDVYRKYNQLQQRAGFDLSVYKGKAATVYTYSVSGEEDTVVNLIVSGKIIIGGDISSVRIDGEMKPLISEKSR